MSTQGHTQHYNFLLGTLQFSRFSLEAAYDYKRQPKVSRSVVWLHQNEAINSEKPRLGDKM